jgi:hypothetical protein
MLSARQSRLVSLGEIALELFRALYILELIPHPGRRY